MAHAARISQLADNLVRSIVTSTNSSVQFDELRDQTSKRLRPTAHNRTNQFEVQSRLSGLVEKFAVLNREDLSIALQSRLNELPTDSKWLPEVLSLLLQLSDRPLEKTKIEDVEALGHGSAEEVETWTWADLIADDPLPADGLWDDVERGYHSSGDDEAIDQERDSDETTSTQATSVVEDDVVALARLHIVPLNSSALDDVQEYRHHIRDESDRTTVSELALIRETLSMLHGLPTTIYRMDDTTGRVSLKPGVRLENTALTTLMDTMTRFAEIGSSLNTLRCWVKHEQPITYVQSCQSSLRQLLQQFRIQLSAIEQRHILASEDVAVSIVHVRTDVEAFCRPLLRISAMVISAKDELPTSPFILLDGLYDEACVSELSGNSDVITAVVPVFIAGLKSYLRSIARWLQSGLCDPNDPISLIAETSSNYDLTEFWHKRYTMRMQSDGHPQTPAFMRTMANKLFAIGKSCAFLRMLRNEYDGLSADDGNVVTPDFKTLEHAFAGTGLLPFSQLLEDLLNSWLTRSVKDATPALRDALLLDHGLLNTIKTLNRLFCSEDGSAFQIFAEAVFWSMDHEESGAYQNEFILTELAQSTLSSREHTTIDTSLTIKVIHDDDDDSQPAQSSIRQLGSITLETMFPWPVQNITRALSPSTYSKVFTFLLQIYRAKYLLRGKFYELRLLRANRKGSHVPALLRLRQHLMTTLDILHAHIATTASTISTSLCDAMQQAANVDAMVDVWSKHDKLLETSLLVGVKLGPLKEALIGHVELCERFADVWRRSIEISMTSEDDEAVESDGDGPATLLSSSHGQAESKKLFEEADRSLSFITAGIRGISRAGGNATLETLAERLEWVVH